MKKVIILMLFLGCKFLWSQDTTNPNNDFWKFVDNYRYDNNNIKTDANLTKQSNDIEVQRMMKSFYKARFDDPVAWDKELYLRHQKWVQRIKEGIARKKEMKPAIVVSKIKEKIDAKYGVNYSEIVSIPYYLKVKIIKIDDVVWKSKVKKNLKAKQSILTCQIEEKIKGNSLLEVGDEIKINYLKWWREECKQPLKVGKSYFIPVTYWWQYDEEEFPFTFKNFDDGYYGIYPVDKNEISVSRFFLGSEKKMSWKEFKKSFTKKYVVEKLQGDNQ